MARLLFPALLIIVVALLGCNNAPTNPDDFGSTGFEQLDGNPVTVDTMAYYVGPHDKNVVVPVQSHTRDAFVANELLSATPHVEWIKSISWPNTEVAAYGSTAMTIEVDRSLQLAPGLYSGFLTLWYNDQYMQLVEVRMQVGTPDAVPLGTFTNFIRIPADVDLVDIGLVNNSDLTWGSSGGWPGHVETPDYLSRFPYDLMIQVHPGSEGGFQVEVNRGFLSPGIHTGQIVLYWYDNPVQTINVELEVGE